ncbi:MAG: tRNA guanosine(34) transglycosylase Tgt [Planctomycetota bacterium]|jgi:queuine tRNA-ribosyltransferase
MPQPLRFTVVAESKATAARVGRVETLHGGFDTPAFMPVGSRGAVKGVTAGQLRACGAQIVLANAYHLLLRPGTDVVRGLGGLHGFMGWDGPIITDSGGYQVFSLSHINRIDDDGVTFRSIVDGSPVRLGPREAMAVQNDLGADIIMAFDDCPPTVQRQAPGDLGARHRGALERTARWLKACQAAHGRADEQALFGIVQGGTDLQLRREALEAVCNVDLPGYAIGGVAVGEAPQQIHEVVAFTAPRLPADRPRYLMGVGYERDIVAAVEAGVDMFDCVLPTRNGRNAYAFSRGGCLRLRNARFRDDGGVIEPGCDCPTCSGGHSRAYLRHLFLAGEMLGPILVSLHNLRHYQRLMLDIQRAIREDSWSRLRESWPLLEYEPKPCSTATYRR